MPIIMEILLLTRYKLYELVGHVKGQNFAFRFTTYIKCINAGGEEEGEEIQKKIHKL